MQHTHLIALKGSAGKGVGVLLCILQVGWGVLHRLYQRTDDVPLQAAVQMVLQKAVGARLELGADDIGFDRLTVGRQLVDGGNVQIAVNHQRQRAGNRGGGHDQRVRVDRFFPQHRTLPHAKAMLFVGDDQRQVGQVHVTGEQCVGPDDKIHHP